MEYKWTLDDSVETIGTYLIDGIVESIVPLLQYTALATIQTLFLYTIHLVLYIYMYLYVTACNS